MTNLPFCVTGTHFQLLFSKRLIHALELVGSKYEFSPLNQFFSKCKSQRSNP